ncbi:MAG: arginine--tRNA ligase [Candidatus Liptonbacteria bacterium]
MAFRTRERLQARIASIFKELLARETCVDISVPERAEFGHYSTNIAFKLAKEEGKPPMMVAGELANDLMAFTANNIFEKVEIAPPGFVNMWIKKEVLQDELRIILSEKEKYNRPGIGKKKTVIVEYASLNIAKPMHAGYLRNIAIGDALANAHEALGYKVIRWNYLGDWGTQFGKIVAAYKMWGDKNAIRKNPIEELQKLYVRFHTEAKDDPELEARGRLEFSKLEKRDGENRRLWEWFKKESLKEYKVTLKKLSVKFDVEIGEAFFERQMRPVIDELVKKGIAVRSEGALVVHLDQFGLPTAMAEKSDGTSLYLTRDLANLRYRLSKYKPARILYVVGNEQSLHFEQVFRVAKMMGLNTDTAEHVKFGLVYAEGKKKFSTREGNTVLLNDLIREAEERALAVVREKHAELSGREQKSVSESIALGALKYVNLRENRNSDIVFDWSKMLDFSGDSAPYLQYTYARLRSIERRVGMRKRLVAKMISRDVRSLRHDYDLEVVRRLIRMPDAIRLAAESTSPNLLALHLYELANSANRFYESTSILKETNPSRRNAHLMLIRAAAMMLKDGLRLLGISAPERI